jgi:pimeloyl-ACP methyl ester carboxylesterase
LHLEICFQQLTARHIECELIVNNYTHQTAPTQFVEAAVIRFAYLQFANRRFGVTIDIPLLFFMHALGYSMGGLIAQQFTIDRPDLVRKLILVGTGPRCGEGMASLTPEAQEIFGAKYDLQTSCGFVSNPRPLWSVGKNLYPNCACTHHICR